MSDLTVLTLLSASSAFSALIEGFFDAKKILRGTEIGKFGHRFSALGRVVFISLASWYYFNSPSMFWVAGTLLSVYWLVLDITINLLRGNHVLYIGKNSYIDKLAMRHTDKGGFFMIKIQVLIIFLTLFYIA